MVRAILTQQKRYSICFALILSQRYVGRYDFIPKYVVCKFWPNRRVLPSLSTKGSIMEQFVSAKTLFVLKRYIANASIMPPKVCLCRRNKISRLKTHVIAWVASEVINHKFESCEWPDFARIWKKKLQVTIRCATQC